MTASDGGASEARRQCQQAKRRRDALSRSQIEVQALTVDAVRAAREAGWSLATIAGWLNVSHQAVSQIARGE